MYIYINEISTRLIYLTIFGNYEAICGFIPFRRTLKFIFTLPTVINLTWYLQFTLKVVLVSNFVLSAIALFHTMHRYTAPSSSRFGVTCKTADVTVSLLLVPMRVIDSMGSRTPSRYHLTIGSGLPPVLVHASSKGRPSVATGLGPGVIRGGLGGVNTVI
jgi:hypothetical protein